MERPMVGFLWGVVFSGMVLVAITGFISVRIHQNGAEMGMIYLPLGMSLLLLAMALFDLRRRMRSAATVKTKGRDQ